MTVKWGGGRRRKTVKWGKGVGGSGKGLGKKEERERVSSERVTAILPLSTATGVTSIAQTLDETNVTVIGGGSVTALDAVVSLTNPERCRKMQEEELGSGDKVVVREYLKNNGFQRWKKIYGDTDDVNRFQLDIRIGHAKTVDNTLKMMNDEGSLAL